MVELEGIRQEVFVTSFKKTQRHLLGGTVEKHKNPSQSRKSLDRDLSLVSAEYRAAVQVAECLSSAGGGVLFIN